MAEITDTELAELQKKAHAYDSEKGRLQKAQSDLEAERAQRAALEQRLAVSQPPNPDVSLDQRAVEVFGPDGMTMLQGMMAPMLEKLNTIGQKFEERDANEAKARTEIAYRRAFDTKLAESNLPGFAARLYDGDLADAWSKFVDARPSIKRAQGDGDVEAVSDAVATFIHQNRELVAGGGYQPNAVSGFSPGVKPDYSDADYRRDMAALDSQLHSCAITEQKYKTESAAIFGRWQVAQEKAESAAKSYGFV